MKKTFYLFFLFAAGISLSYSQVAVIANKTVKVSSINADQLNLIWSLEKKNWDDGSKIKIFDLKIDNLVKNKFYSFIKIDLRNIKKMWLRIQLNGEGKIPDLVTTEDEILEKVSATSGSIGFISKSKVNDKVNILTSIP